MTMTPGTITGKELLWFNNTLVAIHVSSTAGEDGICVVEHRMPYGDSPPLHVHRREDEVFHILNGRLRFQIDGRERIADAGETVIAPKGLPHTYRVESREGANTLTITRGADFETLLRQAGRPPNSRSCRRKWNRRRNSSRHWCSSAQRMASTLLVRR